MSSQSTNNNARIRAAPLPRKQNKPFPSTVVGARPIVGAKKRKHFAKDSEYIEYLESKQEKRKGKKKDKKKKKGKKSSWWDTLLDIGMKVIPKILPFFMSKNPTKAMTYSIHNRSVGGEAAIGAAIPSSYQTSSEPKIMQQGDHVLIEHTGIMPNVVKKYRLGTTTLAARGDVLFSVDLNPQMEAWLCQQCSYAQYDIVQVAFTFHPSVPTVESGQVMGFFEVDPDTRVSLNNGDATMKEAGSLTSAIIVDVWEPHSFIFCFHERQWYWTSQSGTERRLQEQGGFRLIAAKAMDADLPEELGTVTVSYQVRARHAILTPRPELGLSASFVNGTGATATYPFGTTKSVPGIGEVYAAATATMPYMMVPNALPWTYDVVRPGNVAGSCFRFPKGVYSYVYLFHGTTSSSIACAVACDGNYKLMYQNVPTATAYDYSLSDGTTAMRSGAFYSSGIESNSGFAVSATGVTALEQTMLSITSMGGQYPGPTALSAALSEMQSQLNRISPKVGGIYVNSQEGDVCRRRMVMTASGDPIVLIKSGQNNVCVGAIIDYTTATTREVWKIVSPEVIEWVGDKLGFPYTADGGVPAKTTQPMLSFMDKLPSSFFVKIDAKASEAITWFKKMVAVDRSWLDKAALEITSPADPIPWLINTFALLGNTKSQLSGLKQTSSSSSSPSKVSVVSTV